VAAAAGAPDAAGRRLVGLARGRQAPARATHHGIARRAVQLAPERTLDRGYSITRTAAGALVRSPDQVAAGDRLATRLAGGTLTSRVEER
jgi:exodeoxyribonuclease VII large subunit